jgi:SNF family Na+-dependent transporter
MLALKAEKRIIIFYIFSKIINLHFVSEGVKFLFQPDFSKVTSKVVLAALG